MRQDCTVQHIRNELAVQVGVRCLGSLALGLLLLLHLQHTAARAAFGAAQPAKCGCLLLGR
jgi:hypothetical protein